MEAINNMNRNTNSNKPKNNNLDNLPKNTEEFDANVLVELQKRKQLHYHIYIVRNHYQKLLPNFIKPKNTFASAKFRDKFNTTTPKHEKEMRRKQCIDKKKREIHILDKTRRNCLVELEGYEQAIQNIINSLYFNNEQQQIPSQNIPDLKYELYHSVRYITQFLYHSVFISVCSYY